MKFPVFAAALALSSLALPAHAQSTADNLEKYHALRARLVADFTVVGEGAGQSQPADLRDDAEGFIKWADSTIRLGWYLGVLATEHHLSTHPDHYPGAQGPEDTLEELHHALLALERLDRIGDASFPPPCTQGETLNGFFIRDDVPEGFHLNFAPLTTTYSDFVDPVLTNKEMSQDQVYHLLIGLALVKRYVPAGVSVQGHELSAWAVEQARRIVEHMVQDDWVIANPACNRTVNRGPYAMGFSGGTRQAIGFITDGAYIPDTSSGWIDIWASATSPGFLPYSDIDNLHMAMSIAAVGNGWGDTTSEALTTLGEGPNWPLYTLLHRALHDDAAAGWCNTGAPTNARAREMLDELPLGADIASPQPAGPAVQGFTRSNRFMRGAEQAYTGEPGSDGHRYNGLDYMLLHNLYALATPATWDGGNGPGVPECGSSTSSTSSTSSASSASSGAGGSADSAAPSSSEGCSCRSAPRGSGGVWLFFTMLAGIVCRMTGRGSKRHAHAARGSAI